ncbi:MAG: ribosomal-processing cysteine protease Prp [Ruminococcaceae bacterium]|nr:ribosomal-processing cysteine protease Prp [Oscillospiraceae bacterium]
MINVKIFKNNKGETVKFTVSGHAGYGPFGKDIICAAVSAITYTAVGYCKEIGYDGQFVEEDGYASFTPEAVVDEQTKTRANASLDAMCIGLRQIEASYGKKYIRIHELIQEV